MKWLHKLLKGLSLTAALFVFQACYGTPPGYPEAWEEPVEEASLTEAEEIQTPVLEAVSRSANIVFPSVFVFRQR